MNRKIFNAAKFLSLFCVLGLISCGKSEYKGEDPVYNDTFEDDYTYMWHRDGIIDEQDRIIFQSINYSALIDSKTGQLLSSAPYLKEHLESIDDSSGTISPSTVSLITVSSPTTFSSAADISTPSTVSSSSISLT